MKTSSYIVVTILMASCKQHQDRPRAKIPVLSPSPSPSSEPSPKEAQTSPPAPKPEADQGGPKFQPEISPPRDSEPKVSPITEVEQPKITPQNSKTVSATLATELSLAMLKAPQAIKVEALTYKVEFAALAQDAIGTSNGTQLFISLDGTWPVEASGTVKVSILENGKVISTGTGEISVLLPGKNVFELKLASQVEELIPLWDGKSFRGSPLWRIEQVP